MVCAYCGAEVSGQPTFCPRCGRSLEAAQAGIAVAPALPATDTPHGVGGWLLLLCLALTIGIPLLTAYNWSKVFSFGFSNFPWFSLGLSVVMASFSFIAGVLLWKVHPRGLPVAKAYFVTEMALPVFFGARLLIEMLSTRIEMSAWTIFAAFIRPILMGLLGYLYLVRSRRVQATYSQARAATV